MAASEEAAAQETNLNSLYLLSPISFSFLLLSLLFFLRVADVEKLQVMKQKVRCPSD